jgi:hypothetical protein
MPLYRDSLNGFTRTFYNKTTGAVIDISSYDLRLELSQDSTTQELTMGDGLAFVTDGTDGKIAFSISLSRINKFCAGVIRARLFEDSGSDPVLVADGGDTLEGKRFDQ